jgi:ribosomal protein S18 acetylase RimI-like enzyme
MTEAGYDIRTATEADVDAVAAMWGQMASQHHAYDADVWCWSREAIGEWADQYRKGLGAEDMIQLVADEGDGDLLGFSQGLVKDTPPIFANDRMGEVWDLFVSPAARHRGVGRRLMDVTFQAMRERGAGSVILHVALVNEDAARFYESLGMRPVMTRMFRTL